MWALDLHCFAAGKNQPETATKFRNTAEIKDKGLLYTSDFQKHPCVAAAIFGGSRTGVVLRVPRARGVGIWTTDTWERVPYESLDSQILNKSLRYFIRNIYFSDCPLTLTFYIKSTFSIYSLASLNAPPYLPGTGQREWGACLITVP